jgi:surface polysaccharide O-acyltransferase-like enzyme
VTLQSAANATWEALFAAGMCIGLVVIFRDGFNRRGRFARFLSENAFAVYVLHPPVLISISLALRAWAAPPVLKFAVVSAAAVAASFGVAAAVRKIRPLRWVLS